MPNTLQLSFTKIIFQPTPTAWAHTYSAGSFFAVTSLTTPVPPVESDINAIGKEIFTKLETEFFTLEHKNLAAIKQVILTAIDHVPKDIALSLAAVYIKDTILYVFIAGSGSVVLKRAENIATILTVSEQNNQTIKASSGYLQNSDLLFLETQAFANHISSDVLSTMTDHLPNEMADSLNSRLQGIENSAVSCIIIKVEGHIQQGSTSEQEQMGQTPISTHPTMQINQPHEIDTSETEIPAKRLSFKLPSLRIRPPNLPSFLQFKMFRLPMKTKIGLVVACIVLVVLAESILLIKSHQEDVKNQHVFQHYYPEAKNYFDSGNAVANVDTTSPNSLAEYQKADSLLKSAQQQLPSSSQQAKQVSDLLSQVEAKMQAANTIQQVTVTDAHSSDTLLLATENKHTDTSYVASDGTTNYYITNMGIFADNKANPLIKNNNDWQTIGGFGTYEGNFYVLDKKTGILKYVPGSDYGKSSYFAKDISPDVRHAVSIAIDSAIYVLQSNGLLVKYLRGEPTTFNLKGLDKPFSSPTRIVTDANMHSIYVLDNGNSRIVQLGKDGTFQAQYVTDALNKAKDMDVQETNKKIFFLTSSDEIKSIAIQ